MIALLVRVERARDRVLARVVCRAKGHEPCWIWGAALGFRDHPVCSRCWKALD